MIATVTFNPCLDYTIRMDELKIGKINRTAEEKIYPGGKGINVSLMLKNLGVPSRVLGFRAGFTGDAIVRLLSEAGCICDLIDVQNGLSRINVKIQADHETEINGMGPKIGQRYLDILFAQLSNLHQGDYLVLAGSVPSTLPHDIYEQILFRLSRKGVRFIVDASGELLLRVLPERPFLVKPNHHELSALFGVEIKTREEAIPYARKLQEMGAQNVLVSMAGEGAVLLDENGTVHERVAPQGTVINSVGAGDSMVAGFIAGLSRGGDYESAFKLGIASGSESAFSEWLADRKTVEALLAEM